MAITSLWWDGEGYDIHLLKGESSIPLARKLMILRNNSVQFRGDNAPSGVTVEFVAEFKGAPSNHNVTVTPAGKVTVGATLPFPRLHNFILRAIVRETDSNTLETKIRIHIHDAIKKIWLTPDTLTLYAGGGKQRFTVLAEFDDKTFGDITNRNSTVDLNTQNRLIFARLPGNVGNITVDANTGEITAVQENAQQEVRVSIILEATTPELPDEQQSGAIVNTKPTLAVARKITRVNSRVPANFANKTNILFIPDGFQSGEKDLFNQIVERLVKSLQDDLPTFPYNVLKDSINYWRLQDADFLASVDQNVSMLGELDIVGRRISSGKLVPFPVKPPPSATTWKLEHMVYMVGLPVPSDTRTIAQLKTLYDNIVESKISSKVFGDWRALGDRKLINERDTALGMVLNDHPRVDDDPDPLAVFHNRRTTANQFTAFIEALQDGGTPVGKTWTSGNDKGKVCIIARSERNGGTEQRTHFCVTLGAGTEDKLQAVTGLRRGIDLIPMKLTDEHGKLISLSPEVVITIAHESAHTFGLQDEYGGGLSFPPELKLGIIGTGNVQPASELIPFSTGTIAQEDIRWVLPRIKAAGVLTAAPVPSGGNFTVTLVTARAGDFAKDDIVRLRKRDFLADPVLNSDPFQVHDVQLDQVSINPFPGTTIAAGEFPAGSRLIATNTGSIATIALEPSPSIFGGNVLDVVLRPGQDANFNNGNVVRLRKNAFSGRFKVAASPFANQLTLTPLAGTTVPPFIAAGDLLIATVPASLSPLGDDLSIIAPKILSHIGSKGGPLNARKETPRRPCVAASDSGSVMTPTNLPDGLRKGKPDIKANIVGLYEGGYMFDCGIFHPAGLCIMRTARASRTARFCHVCRYLIIDRVDPLIHKELDQIYARDEYPEP